MALNNMGVGFNFTGRDTGLSKTIGSVKAGFVGLAGSVKDIAMTSAKKMFTGFARADSVSQAMGDMKNNLTDLESRWVGYDVVTSKVFAGMGHMSMSLEKAKKTAGGLAYSLNRPIDSIAESMKALEQQGIDVGKIGFGSLSKFIKIMDVADVNGAEMAATIGHLRKEVGLNDKQLKSMIQTTANVGRMFNMGSESMQGMIDMTKLMQEEGQGLFTQWGPERTKMFIESGTALAGMFMQAGHSAKEAQSLAQGLTKVVVGGVNDFQSLYDGLAQDLGPAADILAQNMGGGVQEAFELLQKSPLEFSQKLNEAFTKAEKVIPKNKLQEAIGRFSQQISKEASPAIADFITHGMTPMHDKATELIKAIGAGGLGGPGGIDALNKGFKSGISTQEEYGRILDQMATKLKHLGKVNDSAFNDSLRSSIKVMEGSITAMKGEYKGIGKFFDAIQEINYHGFGGFLGHLDKSLLATQALTKNMGPLGAGVVNLGMLFVRAGRGGKEMTSMFDNMKTQMSKFGAGVGEFINDMIRGFEVLWPVMKDAGSKALMALYNALYKDDPAHTPKEAMTKLWDHTMEYLRTNIPIWWHGLTKLLSDLYKDLGGDQASSAMKSGFDSLMKMVTPYAKQAFHALADAAMDAFWDAITPDFLSMKHAGDDPKGASSLTWNKYQHDYWEALRSNDKKMQDLRYEQLKQLAPDLGYEKLLGQLPKPGTILQSSGATVSLPNASEPLQPASVASYSAGSDTPMSKASQTTKALVEATHHPEWATESNDIQRAQLSALQSLPDQIANRLQSGGGGGGRSGGSVGDSGRNTTGVSSH